MLMLTLPCLFGVETALAARIISLRVFIGPVLTLSVDCLTRDKLILSNLHALLPEESVHNFLITWRSRPVIPVMFSL